MIFGAEAELSVNVDFYLAVIYKNLKMVAMTSSAEVVPIKK